MSYSVPVGRIRLSIVCTAITLKFCGIAGR
jgi:hypothetical protein